MKKERERERERERETGKNGIFFLSTVDFMRESFSLCEKNLYSQPVSRRRNNREHGYLQCYTCNSTPASRISLSGCLPLVPCTLSLFPPLLPALLFKNMQQETGLAARSSTPFNRVYVRAMEKKKKEIYL